MSHDGAAWVAGSDGRAEGSSVSFQAELPTPPRHVRYTAAEVFPQCAVYNELGLPAFPFSASIELVDTLAI